MRLSVAPGRTDASEPLNAAQEPDAEQRSPEDDASLLSRYTFWWMYTCIRDANGRKRLLKVDLPRLPHADRPEVLWEAWQSQPSANDSASGRQSQTFSGARLLKVLTFGIQTRLFLYSFLHGWMFLLLMTIDPLLLGRLLQSAQDVNATSSAHQFPLQLLLVCALSLSMLVRVSCMEICFFASARVMNNMRTVLVHAIFRRALQISGDQLEVGRLTNLMATDADKFGSSAWIIFSLAQWTWAMLSLPFIIYFLYQLVGLAAFVCTATIILCSFGFKAMSDYMQKFNRRVQECRDERTRMMNEFVRGIRVVKLEGWEPLWLERLTATRADEMRALVRVRVMNAINTLLGAILALAMPVSMFASFILLEGKHLDAATAFTALAWISTLQWSIQTIPGAFQMYTYLKPSVDRIDDLLAGAPNDESSSAHPSGGHAISLRKVSVGYILTRSGGVLPQASDEGTSSQGEDHHPPLAEGELLPAPQKKVVLKDVNVEIQGSQLTMIVGPVGCGKSTLLATMSKAQAPLEGVCGVSGKRAYASQKPFLLNDTIKRNILFGLEENTPMYQDAIKRCALEQDFKALVSGDETIVGENGVQLSGGQKARVALARVLYATTKDNADIVLLDDVLSAVDADTGRHLWDNCIVGGLKEKGKTVVLVSHQIQYLSKPEVDIFIMLRDGKVSVSPIKDLTKTKDELLRFVNEWQVPATNEKETETAKKGSDEEESRSKPDNICLGECQAAVVQILQSLQGRRIDPSVIKAVQVGIGGELEAIESVREGSITWPDFRTYLQEFGSWFTIALLASVMIFGAILGVMANVWLSIWTAKTREPMQEEHGDLVVYTLIGLGTGVADCAQALVLTYCALQASRSIHSLMLKRVMYAPLSFFDLTPIGRLLNRFLQDMQNIDNVVPNTINDQTVKTLNIATQLSLIYVEAPWVLFSLPILLVPYQAIFRRMRIPNRDARRIGSVARSPVYAHFSDTLHGRDTIRAFEAEGRFQDENLVKVWDMSQASYGNEAVAKWAQILTTQVGCVLYFVCGIVCVGLTQARAMTAGQLGLILLYAAQLQRAMMDYMMGAAEVEKNFVSVERVAEYCRLEPEAAGQDDAPSLTPPSGAVDIKFTDVALRYRLQRPLVLKGVTLHIPGGEKVAICGRTGCGKSTLFGAICRLYPLAAGGIAIGDKDINMFSLEELRMRVRVVSQDAFLLSGSLRLNLNMNKKKQVDDDVLRLCLEKVKMWDAVSEKGGLDCAVEDGGQNFSVGQRQLLTLARALMPPRSCQRRADWRPPQVLLCDEATANVDLIADELVHNALMELDSTVLMICHRLQHIESFDRVVVMYSGTVIENDEPKKLLGKHSELAQLCKKANVKCTSEVPESSDEK